MAYYMGGVLHSTVAVACVRLTLKGRVWREKMSPSPGHDVGQPVHTDGVGGKKGRVEHPCRGHDQ